MINDTLDELLDRSTPLTTHPTPPVSRELRLLRAATRERAARSRWTRRAVAALAAVAILGGGAAASAAAGMWTLPWADNDSLASFSYTLPSGIVCTQRVGGVAGTNPQVIEATKNFFRARNIRALVTDVAINKAITRERARGAVHVNPDGSTVPGGYGTQYYNADQEYMAAAWDVVVTAMDDDLARKGLKGSDNSASVQSEPNCPGLDLLGNHF